MIGILSFLVALVAFIVLNIQSLIYRQKGKYVPVKKAALFEIFIYGSGYILAQQYARGYKRLVVAIILGLIMTNAEDSDARYGAMVVLALCAIVSYFKLYYYKPKKYKSSSGSGSRSSDFDERGFMEYHHHNDDNDRPVF